MLHQPIQPDPEVAASVVDFRDTVIAIRGHSLRLFYLPQDSDERAAEQEAVDQAVADMQSRCDRLGLPLDDLFALINADLARCGGSPSMPTGEYLLALIRGATDARRAEQSAHDALTLAQARVKIAMEDRLAADRACAGYAADWKTR